MRYTLTNNFTQISETGTLQNVSPANNIEISDTTHVGTGIILGPYDYKSFDTTIYARCAIPNQIAEIRVVPF